MSGPWTAHQYGVRDTGGYICKLIWPSLYSGQDERYWKETAERQADVRLIAAAPELLRELNHLAAILHPWIESGNSVPGIATLNGAFAAIAKATQP